MQKMTDKAIDRMRRVLKWRAKGKTLAWIGLRLKVTRERVRQIERLGEAMAKKAARNWSAQA